MRERKPRTVTTTAPETRPQEAPASAASTALAPRAPTEVLPPEGERYHQSRVDMVPAVLEQQWDCLLRTAEGLLKAGAYPDTIKTKEQGALILLISYELGIPYTAGMRMIDVIYNRPALRAQLVNGLLRSKGCKIEFSEMSEKKCTVKITRPDGASLENTVTMEEIGRMRTFEKGEGSNERKAISLADKANWKQMPKVMLQGYAVKQTGNILCPDMILGLPTDEEVEIAEASRTGDTQAQADAPRQIAERVVAAPKAPALPSPLGDALLSRVSGKDPVTPQTSPAAPQSKALDPDSLI